MKHKYVLRCFASHFDLMRALELCDQCGWSVNYQSFVAATPELPSPVLFRTFNLPQDGMKVAGYELVGVLGLDQITDQYCRAAIVARIRP